MKNTELRIGNLLNTSFGVSVLIGIYSDGVLELEDGNENVLNEVEPIPLTEEWLLKFGFDEDMRLFEAPHLDKNITVAKDNDGNWEFCNDAWWLRDIKHVHQLQNLYFALTGNELTIKEQ